MPIVSLALALFAFAFLSHLVLWRVSRPAATARSLVLTFIVAILGGLALVFWAAAAQPALAAWLPASPGAVLLSSILALALSAGYVMTYPAIEVESPTLVMIQAIARRGDTGLARRVLFEQLDDRVLVAPRVRDLLSEGLAVERGGRLHLGPRGHRLVRLFLVWRRILGAGEGG